MSYGVDPISRRFNNPETQNKFNQIISGSREALKPVPNRNSNQEIKADLIKNWSTYHGKRNSFNPNSSADKAMLDAMVDAKINGKSVVAVADGPLSRPAMRPARR